MSRQAYVGRGALETSPPVRGVARFYHMPNADLSAKPEDLIRVALADFEGLGVEDVDGVLYLPTEMRRRTARGNTEVTDKVVLTCPTKRQKYQAKLNAETFCREELRLDPTKYVEVFNDTESYAILAYALRDPKSKGQLEPNVGSLLDRFTEGALAETWERLNHWTQLVDPRFGELTVEQLWQVIAALARGNPFPLAAMPTYAQSTCFTVMAKAALSSPSAPSWARLPEISHLAQSAEPTSPAASADDIPTESPSASEG